MTRLLVTGARGFIGRNIVEYLSSRYQVFAPAREELDLLNENSVEDYFSRNDIDVVIHSATTPGHRNAAPVEDLVARNLRMFDNIVRNARNFAKMIYLGSGAIYDERHYVPKMEESFAGRYVPADPHGYSKYLIAKFVEHNDDVVELRLFGVFGKHEDYSIRFISNAICKTLFDLPITLRQDRYFDYVFVDDLGPILEPFIERDPAEKFYNVTPDTAVSLKRVAEQVASRAAKPCRILVQQPELGPEYSGSNARLKKFMPQLALTRIEVAIDRLYSWYESRRDSIDQSKLLFDK